MKTVTTQPDTDFFIVHDTDKSQVSTALERLAALERIKHHIELMSSVCKTIITNAVKGPAIKKAIKTGIKLSSNKVVADNGSCLFVPVRKYPKIDTVRYREILNFLDENNIKLEENDEIPIEFEINRTAGTVPTKDFLDILDQNPAIFEDIRELFLSSKKISEKTKKAIKQNKVKLSQEEIGDRYYVKDFIENVPTICNGNAKLTEELFDLIEPQIQFKSFQLDNKTLSINDALDILKEKNLASNFERESLAIGGNVA